MPICCIPEREPGAWVLKALSTTQSEDVLPRWVYKYEGKQSAVDRSLVFEDKPVTKHRAGRWKTPENTGRIIGQFRDCPRLCELLISYGYETDNTCLDQIDHRRALEPALSLSH